MKKFGLLLTAALLALCLGGCAAEDASVYTEYNGVNIPNEDIAVMRNMYAFIDASAVPADEQLLATLARQQVQIDEAERLGLLPSKGEAEAYNQEQQVKPVMQWLASDDPMMHESALFYLMLLQDQAEALGMNHDEFCDYIINQYQKLLGINALQQHVLSQTGLTPGEMSQAVYEEYVDGLLAQAAQGAAAN